MSVAVLPSFPGHDGGAWAPVPTDIVATWPAGHFAENLAVDARGAVFVSVHSHDRIDRYEPATGRLEVFCELPAPATGLAFDADGVLWVSGGRVGRAPGYVWRISATGAQEWVHIPDAMFLNGCALLPGRDVLLVCESLTGRVLAVDGALLGGPRGSPMSACVPQTSRYPGRTASRCTMAARGSRSPTETRSCAPEYGRTARRARSSSRRGTFAPMTLRSPGPERSTSQRTRRRRCYGSRPTARVTRSPDRTRARSAAPRARSAECPAISTRSTSPRTEGFPCRIRASYRTRSSCDSRSASTASHSPGE